MIRTLNSIALRLANAYYGNIHLYLNEISSNKNRNLWILNNFFPSTSVSFIGYLANTKRWLMVPSTLPNQSNLYVCNVFMIETVARGVWVFVWPFAIYVKISTRFERTAWRSVAKLWRSVDKIGTRYKSKPLNLCWDYANVHVDLLATAFGQLKWAYSITLVVFFHRSSAEHKSNKNSEWIIRTYAFGRQPFLVNATTLCMSEWKISINALRMNAFTSTFTAYK